jgi:hypothetical protein
VVVTVMHRRLKGSEGHGDTTYLYSVTGESLVGILYSYPAQVAGVPNLMSAVIMHSAFTLPDGIDLGFGPVKVRTKLHGPGETNRDAFLEEIESQQRQAHSFASYSCRLTLVWPREQQPFSASPVTPAVPCEVQDVMAIVDGQPEVSERTWRVGGPGRASPYRHMQYSWISSSDAGSTLRFDRPTPLPPSYQFATFLGNSPQDNPAYMQDAAFFMWEDVFGVRTAPCDGVVPMDRPDQPLWLTKIPAAQGDRS